MEKNLCVVQATGINRNGKMQNIAFVMSQIIKNHVPLKKLMR